MKCEVIMNNQMPFFNPFMTYPLLNNNDKEIDKILNRIDKIEKNIQILESKVRHLEQKNNNTNYIDDEPTDMYII